MTAPDARSRAVGATAAIVAVAGVAAWAAAQTAAPSEAVTVLAGISGVCLFAACLSPVLAPRRHRTMATGLVLIGVAVVVAATKETTAARTSFVVASGIILFCAAETADRSVSRSGRVERRRGVDRSGTVLMLAVAAGSGAVCYGAISARELLSGAGPAGLAAGTVAAILVAVLTVMALRTRSRPGA
jgi:hypothetical protein